MHVGAGIAAWFSQPRHMTPIVPCSPSPFLLLSPGEHLPGPLHGSLHPSRATLLPQADYEALMAIMLQGHL